MQRRTLLLTGAALGCAFAQGARSAFAAEKAELLPADADVVIIGSGAAGLTAACRAIELGIERVVVLEKEPFVGGSSIICGGQWAVSGTAMLRRLGIEDSDELFVDDMLRTGGGKNDVRLVRRLVQVSRKQYEWVLARGVKPMSISLASGMSVPRAHTFDPAAVVNLLLLEALKGGVRVVVGARASKLLIENGRIAGVEARMAGKRRTIRSRAVLIATGGFSRNKTLMKKYAPLMERAARVSGIGSDGDGLVMAAAIGATLRDMDFITASYGFTMHPSSIRDFTLVYYAGGIILNQKGKRFVDESIPYKDLGSAALREPGYGTYILFDDEMRRRQMRVRPNDALLWRSIDEGVIPDYVFRGETIAQASAAAGLDAEAVQRTVDAYNAQAPIGKDPIGRRSLSSGYGVPICIEHPPYFIMPAQAGVMGTYCGLVVSPDAEVLDSKGAPIPGLYAAGEVCGGFHGRSYITGTAFAKANGFGRVAAEEMHRFLKRSLK